MSRVECWEGKVQGLYSLESMFRVECLEGKVQGLYLFECIVEVGVFGREGAGFIFIGIYCPGWSVWKLYLAMFQGFKHYL